MTIKPVFFWSDLLIYVLFATILVLIFWAKKRGHWRAAWTRICHRKLAMMALVLLLTYSLVALLDSIHFRVEQQELTDASTYQNQIQSLLDVLIRPLGQQDENTYSAPFALYSSAKTTAIIQGQLKSFYPRLVYGGRLLTNPQQKASDITKKSMLAVGVGLSISILGCLIGIFFLARRYKEPYHAMILTVLKGETVVAWREILLAVTFVIIIGTYIKMVSPYYHILGTNKIGSDILYETIKSIRTGLIIGTLTTLVMLPFAIFFGTDAGYYGGWRDDVIQYIYTTLSSVPAVLLISAAVLSLQVFIANHTALFPTLESRADVRLLALCLILGITSWTSLCRLLRAETLKLREMDYVKAAQVLGVSHAKIIIRHIIPNLMHIILITLVLDFSSLVLAEAVLSYVGVGVDPITPSWGNMINSARLDLAREPIVWWPLFAAFIFMFFLVLAANLFADAVRDAFDPRLRSEQ